MSDGLQNAYKSDEEVRVSCGMLNALAFLPLDRVKDPHPPNILSGLIDYFDGTYVSGKYRAVMGTQGTLRFR